MERRTYGRAARYLGNVALVALATGGLGAQVAAQDSTGADEDMAFEEVVVTGSRIVRKDYVANSPVSTVGAEELNSRADVTIDTFLNTLPQVNPAGTTSSNNPGNNGQSNIDLRGLGANRNLVLVDGRRTMVSASNMTVDLNTIPAAMIDSIEIITGGAGAAYGADAIAGAVNIKLKNDFEGLDVRANYSNSLKQWDAKEYNVSGVIGGNFADDKGNAIFSFDYSSREALIKSQREFAEIATSTTSFFPEGRYFSGGNNPTQASVDAIFAQYGVGAGAVPANGSIIGFNLDGTLIGYGGFNTPIDVVNWRYPIDNGVNTSLFPDVYSYNFDAVNLLILPVERKSFSTKINYELSDSIEVFASASWTNYNSATALAPTPFPTVGFENTAGTESSRVKTDLVVPGGLINNTLIVPVTNPFIPADFAAVLASRSGDNPNLVGSGATEPFLMRSRSLWGGLRQSNYDNTVLQYMAGLRGTLGDNWRWEAYAMEGKTTIEQRQTGNLDTQRIQNALEAADGGASLCAGGYNPFGRQEVSQECVDYFTVDARTGTVFKQQIAQGYITGELFEAPAGPVSVVAGAETRHFKYDFDPGSLSGPVSGFNTQDPAGGKNRFNDIFLEALVPLASGESWAETLELSLGYRLSSAKFTDTARGIVGEADNSSAFKAELSWQVDPSWPRFRGSYQKSVRAPNFGELFDGGGAAPQYFDPCSVTTVFRTSGGADARALCAATGVGAPDTYSQTPGTQASINTTGNTELQPEKGTTITLGAVYNAPTSNQWTSRLVASLDYYNIKVTGLINTPNVNLLIADCYNYYGNNQSMSADYGSCQYIFRAGGDILALQDPNTDDGNIPGNNQGFTKTTGLDLLVGWGFDLEWLGASPSAGSIDMSLSVNHVMDYKVQEWDFLPVIDYAGTVPYFGVGLGQTFPKWKANLNTRWTVGDFSVDLRSRFIDGMKNRASVEFLGETSPTGTKAVWYFDTAVSWNFTENMTFRAGLNNLFNKQPQTYAPNVQSGTDPSTYDVIGRRLMLSANFRF
ncbi:TonB-dependent receptor domain-containing protein [Gimibacter soli]|uniref:TonB-dependent receptor n=1 Tax=Gimibacter soli TaxID=3024400 RepID=A0AAF0BG55_9PROT|nr:TonB-dependent receptor [Gimibacter soli]WCL53203.1 TonB-dependent receptor [Gimibacter soli]